MSQGTEHRRRGATTNPDHSGMTRLLPRWIPIAECIAECWQSAAFDRRDGRCYFHGKIHDGIMQRCEDESVGREDDGLYRHPGGRKNLYHGVSTPHQRQQRGAA